MKGWRVSEFSGMNATDLHHEIARNCQALLRKRVHVEDKEVFRRHVLNIQEAVAALSRKSEQNRRAGSAVKRERV